MEFIATYWWLWPLLTGVSLWFMLWQMRQAKPGELQKRAYNVSGIYPLCFFALLTVLGFIVVVCCMVMSG